MKCRKCNEKAIINMRQHKLALCKAHFPDWIQAQTQRTIEKYHMFSHQDRLLVAVSGGKDSLSLWDILQQLCYQADGLYIGLGIDNGTRYSELSQQHAEQFAQQNRLKLHVINLQQHYGASITQMAACTNRGREKPCSVCGMVKRHVMNRVARQEGYDVLLTGHNLDDEVATLFGNTLNWNLDYLRRQDPVLPASHPGLARKAKPLFRIYEREMTAYALVRGIHYIYAECPYAVGSNSIYYKEILNQLEKGRPGAKLGFFISFLQAKTQGLFSTNTERLGSMEEQDEFNGISLSTCPNCEQPTTAPGLCAFCRIIERLNK